MKIVIVFFLIALTATSSKAEVNAYMDVSRQSMDDLFSLWEKNDQEMMQLLGEADARMDARALYATKP